MSAVIEAAQGGRAAAIAHRKAVSAGKSGLPPAQERSRSGKRAATSVVAESVEPASPKPAAPAPQQTAPAAAAPVYSASVALASGRLASIQRRRELSQGKAALQSSTGTAALLNGMAPAAVTAPATGRNASIERRRQLSRGKGVGAAAPAQGAAAEQAAPETTAAAPVASANSGASSSCRDVARARRAAIACGGRAGLAGAVAPQIVQQGTVVYAPKVTESGTQGGQRVTGIRIGDGRQMTGDERGAIMPVSGTQYIDTKSAIAYRAAAPKVGLMATIGGQTVSGTMVRSQVRVTGDEAGGSVAITGKADQRLDDDLTPRTNQVGGTSAQFQRQANPHGGTFSTGNLGRSVQSAGSRERSRSLAIEATERGQRITGSAVGRSVRMTGDETGACRSVTGNQYLTPASRQTACGFSGGGTAPVAQAGGDRADPVTAGKVGVSQSWGGQRITGMDVEHNARVTGDEPGSCSALTGSQYQGLHTASGWCEPASAGAMAARRAAAAGGRVTGDTPSYTQAVTGTARGAARDVTGTPYHSGILAEQALPANPVAEIEQGFSVHSPQRSSHLRELAAAPNEVETGRITGSFAVGQNKVTGNVEFTPQSRAAGGTDKTLAHSKISGEGRDVSQITGDAWGSHSKVTGVEGAFTADRNPTQRGPKAKAFAGSNAFKSHATHEEPKQLVTGMFYFAKTGARITLSGGAQGMIRRSQNGKFGLGNRGAENWNRASVPGPLTWTTQPGPSLPAECGRHPLTDRAVSQALQRRADEIDAAFEAIEPVLRNLAPAQFDEGFARRATTEILALLHLDLAADLFASDWLTPIDMRKMYARCVLRTFCRLVERAFDRGLADVSDGESVEVLIQRWGFHAIDITPCADGRLSGVVDYILRIPPSVVAYRKSYAGAMFDIEESIRHWESTELRRWREGVPNAPDAPTRYLKVGVYHFSSLDPDHHGCAAHGSNAQRAAGALLERLEQFAIAIRLLHGESASVATLLVGVDTDTDGIRVHVPDRDGKMLTSSYLDSNRLYNGTTGMPRESAKSAIRTAVAVRAGVTEDDAATSGMRWFCGYLLKNNIAQVDAVRERHGGAYHDTGHTERLIVVGDAVDDVQLRNLAFQAQMQTVEEGAADLDVGVAILSKLNEERQLPVPVLVHFRADCRIPGSIQRAQANARRLAAAILARYADLAARGGLLVEAVVREGDSSTLHPVELAQPDMPEMEAHA